MKKILLALLLLPAAGFSQPSILNKLKQKVKDRVEQRVDQGMDNSLDKSEEELEKQIKAKPSTQEQQPEHEAVQKKQDAQELQPARTSLQVYSRYDFIPGEHIVYAEDFSQDVIGEFAVKWATNNRGEVVTLEGLPNQWTQMFPGGQVISPALKVLPENFTAEFDLVLQYKPGEDGYPYPNVSIKLMELPASDANSKSYLNTLDPVSEVAINLSPAEEEASMVSLSSTENGASYFTSNTKGIPFLNRHFGKPMHIAIWRQKERIRFWINGEKVYDLPKAVPAKISFNRLAFDIPTSAYKDEQVGTYISNIKIAEGAPDMRSKLITEGKFITTGILFDVASSNIKPESYGVIKEIAGVLKESGTVKVKIVGHTDSDGEGSKNLELSKRRAASVKHALVSEFKIDADRLETDGMGETKPVSDNTTREGKLQNRRVEFIKQ